jgi:hypothetical protein
MVASSVSAREVHQRPSSGDQVILERALKRDQFLNRPEGETLGAPRRRRDGELGSTRALDLDAIGITTEDPMGLHAF